MTGRRRTVFTSEAPEAIGPYSQGVVDGELLFCSGAIPLGGDGEIVGETPGAQTEQCLRNLAAVAEAAGTDLARALRLTVYTTRLDAFAEINEAYARAFGDDPPARVAVGVDELPRGAQVEIDAIVAMG
jgi:2-iminobutanoate/2-iminopropanoate deaminase